MAQSAEQIAVAPDGAADAVLEVCGLRKRFGGVEVLRGVDLTLRRGEVVLLRGPNGAGKTTLINILTGHLEADAGDITISVNGTVERFRFPFGFWKRLNPFLHFLPERVAREGIMRTWQDTRLFPSLSLAENIAVAAPKHPGQNPLNLFLRPKTVKRFEQQATRAAVQRLQHLQLEGRDASSGDRISLGQTKRVAIAQAVSAGAGILFFDEPLAGLDAEGIATVVGMLQELAQDHGISIVVVEHQMNAPHILKIADTLWNLDQGVLTTQMAREEKQNPDHARTDVFAAFLQEQGWTIAREQLLPRGARLQVYRNTTLNADTKPILEVQNLAVKRGKRWVIGRKDAQGHITDTLNLALHPGDLALLLAPNGWGKTTALDAIAGLTKIMSGAIFKRGKRCDEMPSWYRSAYLRYIRSNSNLFSTLSIAEQLKISGMPNSEYSNSFLSRPINTLSGGERRYISFCTNRKDILLIDEAFISLDMQNKEHFFESIFLEQSGERCSLMASPTIIE